MCPHEDTEAQWMGKEDRRIFLRCVQGSVMAGLYETRYSVHFFYRMNHPILCKYIHWSKTVRTLDGILDIGSFILPSLFKIKLCNKLCKIRGEGLKHRSSLFTLLVSDLVIILFANFHLDDPPICPSSQVLTSFQVSYFRKIRCVALRLASAPVNISENPWCPIGLLKMSLHYWPSNLNAEWQYLFFESQIRRFDTIYRFV